MNSQIFETTALSKEPITQDLDICADLDLDKLEDTGKRIFNEVVNIDLSTY